MKTRDMMDIAVGAGIGAAAMYLFDPDKGPERREHVADRATEAARDTGERLGSAWTTARSTAGDVTGKLSKHAHDAYSAARSTAADWVDAAGHAGADASRAAMEAGSGFLNKARHMGSHFFERARDMGSSVADHARGWGSSASDSFDSARKATTRYARGWRSSAMSTANRLRGKAGDAADEVEGHWYSRPAGVGALSASGAAAVAVGLIYFLDPRSGAARRKSVADKISSCVNQTGEYIDAAYKSVTNHGKGWISEMRSHMSGSELSDDIIVEHIHAKIGHLIQNPGAVEVSVRDGMVTLNGPVAFDELDGLISYVASMRGVHGVTNQLRGDGFANTASGGVRGALARASHAEWTPAVRTASGVTGGALAVYGATRKDWVGVGIGLLGLGLLARSASSASMCQLTREGKELASKAAGQATDLTARAGRKISDAAHRMTGGNGKHSESVATSMPVAPAESQSIAGLTPQ